MIKEAVLREELHGMQISKTGPEITHLFFADDSLLFCKADLEQILTLKQILADYELCSGQQVNMDKSSIFFSKNVLPHVREEICNELGGIKVQTSSKYLGLPLVVGRSKAQVFKFIQDSTASRINSWKNRFLSSAGKEVLLKSVIMALPNYTMSCYKLSNALCKQIERQMANHWWGETDKTRKLHWASWDKLSASKKTGGLEFRDLRSVNAALLAKQVWRLISEPQLLMSRVLKGRYFPQQDFFQVKQRGQDSWLWKSWLGAKSLVERGSRWRVYDGRAVHIWTDRWIPNDIGGKAVSSPPANCATFRVSDLIDHRRKCWKSHLVQQLFLPQEANQILQLPIYQLGFRDQRVWHLDSSGIFSVKSAYRLARSVRMEVKEVAESSSTRAVRGRMWQQVWKMEVKPKLKHFLWRVLHNWIATGSAVRNRGMDVDTICKRCGLGLETREHLFFNCEEAALVWKLAPIHWDGLPSSPASFESWWQTLCLANQGKHLTDRMELSVYLLWYIWKARCAWQFQNQRWEAHTVIQKALFEWQNF